MNLAPAEAEVAFTSTVSAEEIRFTEVPDSRVDLTGNVGPGSGSGSKRTRLADPVRPGVTYDNIAVDYRIVARLPRNQDA